MRSASLNAAIGEVRPGVLISPRPKLTRVGADYYGDAADVGLCFTEKIFVSDVMEIGKSVLRTDKYTGNE